jgi:hypothetical protein
LSKSEEWLLDPSLKPRDPAPKRKPGRPRAVNFDVCSKYEVELIKSLTNKLIAAEDEMGKTATQLCGRIIQALNYTHDRTLGNLGKQIYEGTYGKEKGKDEMGVEEAEYMKHHELEISQRKYTDLKLRLDKVGSKIPSAKALYSWEKDFYYPTEEFHGGLKANLGDMAKHMIQRTCKLPDVAKSINALTLEDFPLQARINTGFDGSGKQQTAMQASRMSHDISQGNREVGCASLRDIKTKHGVSIFDNEFKASPSGMLPWMIVPEKENRELMEKFMPLLNEETKELEENPIEIVLESGVTVPIQVKVDLVYVDGKAIKEASGLGGAACVLCTSPDKDIHDVAKVKDGFLLDRSMKDAVEIAERLYDEEIGAIVR